MRAATLIVLSNLLFAGCGLFGAGQNSLQGDWVGVDARDAESHPDVNLLNLLDIEMDWRFDEPDSGYEIMFERRSLSELRTSSGAGYDLDGETLSLQSSDPVIDEMTIRYALSEGGSRIDLDLDGVFFHQLFSVPDGIVLAGQVITITLQRK